MQSVATFLSACILAAAIVSASFFLREGLIRFNEPQGIVSVKGLAERNVEADLGVWRISHTVREWDLPTARQKLQANQQIIESFLKQNGFETGEYARKSINLFQGRDVISQMGDVQEYKNYFDITQTITVRSTKVRDIEKAAQNTFALIAQDVLLTNSDPVYMYTKLNDIKPDMITEATQNARQAAQRFAQDSSSKVGTIMSADQGWFNILSAYGSDVEAEQASIEKKVRVITTVNFSLVD
ncbi:MAG: SIMPL domain-containing protein [Alphaproteobacteria bacterium]|nr:SIMPL domain-containing protein [Alphaproteobacteria bacterium]MCB9974511.1 SIMPL domain-containing protein [Rhodospirillales bacterium]